VEVGDVDVSEAYAASIFKVDMCSRVSFCEYIGGGKEGTGTSSGTVVTVDKECL
jgi:hypothetical protein